MNTVSEMRLAFVADQCCDGGAKLKNVSKQMSGS